VKQPSSETPPAVVTGLLDDIIRNTEHRLRPDDGGDGPPEVVIRFVFTGDEHLKPEPVPPPSEPKPRSWLWLALGAALGLNA